MPPKIQFVATIGANQSNGRAKWLISAISLLGVALLYLSQHGVSHAVSRSSRLETFYSSENAALGLRVERQADDLILLWNQDAPAIRSAVTGILVVQAGDNRQEFVLRPQDLQTGKFTYRSPANQINLRLHVFDINDRQTNDSAVLSLEPESNRQSVALPPLAARSGEPGRESSKTARRGPTLVSPADSDGELFHSETLVSRSHQSDVTTVQIEDPPKLESSLSVLPPPRLIEPVQSFLPPSVGAGLENQGAATKSSASGAVLLPVVGEAPSVSPLQRTVTAIPLVKRLFHNSDFVPATPSLSPVPQVPDSLRQRLKQAVSVDVRIFVNADGDVRYAELLTNGTGTDREIASLAVFESRRWKFHPALMRGKPRDSEVILHYRFSP